jgi:hypothetical protein
MTATTPKFGIHYPVDADPVYMLPRVLKTMATDVDTAMGALDYNGADPSSVLSRVASLELRAQKLEAAQPSVSQYTRQSSFAVPQGPPVVVPSFSALSVGSGVSYDGTKWTFSSDCTVTASLVAARGARVMSWASDQRHWVELVKNSVTASPTRDNELARSMFANEDLTALAFSGKFAAGEYLTVYAYHSFSGGQPFGPFTLTLTVQKAL